jgi:hypothetical protein
LNNDCNDNDPLQMPGRIWYRDIDNDAYSNGTTLTQCARPTGYKAASELLATSGDCNDMNAAIRPGATELCNGIDDNCNGQIDENAGGGLTHIGNVVLGSQSAVDAFSPCVTVIQGNLIIQNAGVHNLNRLANLVKVTGYVTIKQTGLNDMHGLDNLQKIGGTLTINNNPTRDSLAGLEELDTVGGQLKIYFRLWTLRRIVP